MLIVMRLGQHDLNFLHSVSSLLRIKNHVTIAIHFTIAELKTAVKNIEKKSGTHVGGLELTTLMQFLSDIYFMIVFLKENLSINLAPFMNKDDDHQS